MSTVTKPIMLDETGEEIRDTLKGLKEATENIATILSGDRVKIYGMHIDGNESSPSAKITYLDDAVEMIPVGMDYANDKFDYGSWSDVWFIKECKPCILKQDGSVQCYLDKNDYSKDVDGNTVTIDENLTGANVMVEFPKIWLKIVPDENDPYSGSVYVSNQRVDSGYKDYAYIDSRKRHQEHFYIAAYNSSTVSSVLRSISGQTSAKTKFLDASEEISYAEANGTGWSTEHAGQIMLVNFLLMLIGKSTNTQAVFGEGITSGAETAFNNYKTGSLNNKGLFYGDDGASTAVKVFGMENWHGLQWRRYRGDILSSGNLLTKLCYGQEDGSTVDNFNLDGTGYRQITNGSPGGTSGQYISQMLFDDSGMFTKTANNNSASNIAQYCDVYWFIASGVHFTLRGGSSNGGSLCGAFFVDRSVAAGARAWAVGAVLSFI